MTFVNPWWLNMTFFFSSGDSITDLNSQQKLGLVTTVLFFKEEGHRFSVPGTQVLLITFWWGWFSPLLRTQDSGFALVMCGTWLSLASAVPVSLTLWRAWEGRSQIAYFLPLPTVHPFPSAAPHSFQLPLLKADNSNVTVDTKNLYSVQHPNFLDYCFYSCKTPVIKGG